MKRSKKIITWIAAIIVAGVIIIVALEWDAAKKGAKDAWKGNYDPPGEQVD